MKKYLIPILATIFLASFVYAAPDYIYQRSILPQADSTFTLGTTTYKWLSVFTNTLCLNGDCKSAWPSGGPGSFVSTTINGLTDSDYTFVGAGGLTITTSSPGIVTFTQTGGSYTLPPTSTWDSVTTTNLHVDGLSTLDGTTLTNLTSSGKILIGNAPSTNVVRLLEVTGVQNTGSELATSTVGIVIRNTNSSAVPGRLSGLYFANTQQESGTYAGIEGRVTGSGAGGQIGDLVFETKSTLGGFPLERMTLTSGGLLGLNTTTPSNRLTVTNASAVSPALFENTGVTYADPLTLQLTGNAAADRGTGLMINVPYSGGNVNGGRVSARVTGSSNASTTYLLFETRKNGVLSEGMRLDGLVGLSVSMTTTLSTTTISNETVTTSTISSLNFTSATGTNLNITGDTNLNNVTSTRVYSSAFVASSTSGALLLDILNGGFIRLRKAGDSTTYAQLRYNSTWSKVETSWGWAFDNGGISIGAGYQNSTVPSGGLIASGNVGIGTPSPSTTLHVIGNGLFTGTVSTTNISVSGTISDYFGSVGTQGQILMVSSSGRMQYMSTSSLGITGGASTFLSLSDTPSSYSGQANKVLRVNGSENAVEFVTISAGGGDAYLGNDQTFTGRNTYTATSTFNARVEINTTTMEGAFLNIQLDGTNNALDVKDSLGVTKFSIGAGGSFSGLVGGSFNGSVLFLNGNATTFMSGSGLTINSGSSLTVNATSTFNNRLELNNSLVFSGDLPKIIFLSQTNTLQISTSSVLNVFRTGNATSSIFALSDRVSSGAYIEVGAVYQRSYVVQEEFDVYRRTDCTGALASTTQSRGSRGLFTATCATGNGIWSVGTSSIFYNGLAAQANTQTGTRGTVFAQSVQNRVNGIERLMVVNSASQSSTGVMLHGQALGGGFLMSSTSLPMFNTFVAATVSSTSSTIKTFIGFLALATNTTPVFAPTSSPDGVYFTNCLDIATNNGNIAQPAGNCRETSWVAAIKSGVNMQTSSCAVVDPYPIASTTNGGYSALRIEYTAFNQVKFLVDHNTLNGIDYKECANFTIPSNYSNHVFLDPFHSIYAFNPGVTAWVDIDKLFLSQK